jgi:hypothetical protein
MNIGNLLRITRIFLGLEFNTITGVLLHFHPVEPIRDTHRKSFNIKLLGNNGTIQEFILKPEDEVEVLG